MLAALQRSRLLGLKTEPEPGWPVERPGNPGDLAPENESTFYVTRTGASWCKKAVLPAGGAKTLFVSVGT